MMILYLFLMCRHYCKVKNIYLEYEKGSARLLAYCNTQTKPERQSAGVVVPHRFIFIQAGQLIIAIQPRVCTKCIHIACLRSSTCLLGLTRFPYTIILQIYVYESTLSPACFSTNQIIHYYAYLDMMFIRCNFLDYIVLLIMNIYS